MWTPHWYLKHNTSQTDPHGSPNSRFHSSRKLVTPHPTGLRVPCVVSPQHLLSPFPPLCRHSHWFSSASPDVSPAALSNLVSPRYPLPAWKPTTVTFILYHFPPQGSSSRFHLQSLAEPAAHGRQALNSTGSKVNRSKNSGKKCESFVMDYVT